MKSGMRRVGRDAGHLPCESDPIVMLARAKERFRRMSREEKVQTLVDAGILTKDKKIKPRYKQALAGL